MSGRCRYYSSVLLWFSWRGLTTAWPVFAVMVLFGVARAFSMPASQSLLPNLVDREHFGPAVAFNSSMWQVTTIAGPALKVTVERPAAPPDHGRDHGRRVVSRSPLVARSP